MNKKNILIILAAVVLVNMGAKLAFAACAAHHIDLVRPMFVGLCVAWAMAVLSLSSMPFLKDVPMAPSALGVGAFIGEIISEVTNFQS